MSKAIRDIVTERLKVLETKSIEKDVELYPNGELSDLGAIITYAPKFDNVKNLLTESAKKALPDFNQEYLKKLINKPYRERLIIGAQLFAAEIDRIDYVKEQEDERR